MASVQSYLASGLRMKNNLQLTTMQLQCLTAIDRGKSVFLNSPNGTGKTLAYLIPIMNKILEAGKRNPKNPHGAIIFVPTKQLALQVYSTIRELDYDCRLNVSRMGSISYYSNIVQLLNQPASVGDIEQSRINEIAIDNVIASVKWELMDMLVTTPTLLNNLIKFNRTKINPKYVVLDEADELLEINDSMVAHTRNAIRSLASRSSEDRDINAQRQFFLSCSSFPPKIEKRNSTEVLGKWFENLEVIQCSDQHTFSKQLQMQLILMRQLKGVSRIEILEGLLTNAFKQPARVIVFVSGIIELRMLEVALSKSGFNPILLVGGMDTNSRIAAISKFQTSEKALLIGTDLASRGLDFLDVSLVINYNMPKHIVDFYNRCGRTARFGKPGKVINFANQQDEQMCQYIKRTIEKNGVLDMSFGRTFMKRSTATLNELDQRL